MSADKPPVLQETPAAYTAKTTTQATPSLNTRPAMPSTANQPATPIGNGATAADKPKPLIPNLNAGSSSIKIPSLSDLAYPSALVEDDEEDPYLKGEDKETFTYDDFLKLWHDYVAKIKAEDKPMTLLTIFIENAPKQLNATQFEIPISNKTQEIAFRDERPLVLNFLRTNLKNFEVEVNTRIDEKAVVKKPYTTSEKFQHMAGKNPQLNELRKRFNLDLDY